MLKDLQDEQMFGTFYEPELLNTKQNKFRIDKVIERTKIQPEWNGLDRVPSLTHGNLENLENLEKLH